MFYNIVALIGFVALIVVFITEKLWVYDNWFEEVDE